jgi:hypothetical protein
MCFETAKSCDLMKEEILNLGFINCSERYCASIRCTHIVLGALKLFERQIEGLMIVVVSKVTTFSLV